MRLHVLKHVRLYSPKELFTNILKSAFGLLQGAILVQKKVEKHPKWLKVQGLHNYRRFLKSSWGEKKNPDANWKKIPPFSLKKKQYCCWPDNFNNKLEKSSNSIQKRTKIRKITIYFDLKRPLSAHQENLSIHYPQSSILSPQSSIHQNFENFLATNIWHKVSSFFWLFFFSGFYFRKCHTFFLKANAKK